MDEGEGGGELYPVSSSFEIDWGDDTGVDVVWGWISVTWAPRCPMRLVPKVMLTTGTVAMNRLTSVAQAEYPAL